MLRFGSFRIFAGKTFQVEESQCGGDLKG